MNTVQLRAGQTSQPFPVGIGSVVTITPSTVTGATGYIEYTLSPQADILNNLAVWLRWPNGAVSVATSKIAFFSFFVRGVCTVGNLIATFGDSTSSRASQSIPWSDNDAVFTFAADGTPIGVTGGTNAATGSSAWASRPAVSSVPLRTMLWMTDVGAGTNNLGGGSLFFTNSTRWKPVNSGVLLDAVDTTNTSIANTTEQNLNPNRIGIPGGVIGNFDRLRLWVSLSKSGTVDSTTLQIKFGPLGTIADPSIGTITTLATTNQSIGFLLEYKRLSATTIQKQGNASTDVSFNGASAGAFPAAVTVANMDNNAMFLSITSQMTTGVETVSLQDYTLELYATDSA